VLQLQIMQSQDKDRKYCNELKVKTKETYTKVKSVYCPILDSEIKFNSIGFRHLQYKPDGTARDVKEVIYKMKLYPLAIPVIKNAIGISEKRNVQMRVSRRKGATMKKGIAYALVAIVGNKNPVAVRVIIVKLGKGQPFFYSIMKDNKKR